MTDKSNRTPYDMIEFEPGTRLPVADGQRVSARRTDLRKLSAWIKMMRALEEAKKHRGQD